jgi:hypothetical protein
LALSLKHIPKADRGNDVLLDVWEMQGTGAFWDAGAVDCGARCQLVKESGSVKTKWLRTGLDLGKASFQVKARWIIS